MPPTYGPYPVKGRTNGRKAERGSHKTSVKICADPFRFRMTADTGWQLFSHRMRADPFRFRMTGMQKI